MSHLARRTRSLRTGDGQPPDWAVLSLVCLAQFMVVLDISIVNVALPAIRNDLGLPPPRRTRDRPVTVTHVRGTLLLRAGGQADLKLADGTALTLKCAD